MPRYVALLRGINVGGKTLIRMADLKSCFEDGGFDDVATYIASGNVVFGSSDRGVAPLTRRIERMLADHFELDLSVVLRTRAQMRSVVERAPRDFGADPSRYRSDVIFLKSPLTPAKAMEVVRTRDGVDQAWRGSGVLYFSRLTSRATQSRMSAIVGTPAYQLMTIRSWKTTTAVAELVG
ncbi:MAG: DUF1697 domain-containing protein [Mycobacterium sp.]